jgi:hypothetical protein
MTIVLLVIGLPVLAIIIQFKKEETIREKIFGAFMILFFLGIGFICFKEEYKLKSNCKFTKGVVKAFKYQRHGKYSLVYNFYVNERKYTGKTVTHSFNCLKNKSCLGNEFLIAYSDKDPTNNEIYLGKFEKYKATLNFFDINWRESDLYYLFAY